MPDPSSTCDRTRKTKSTTQRKKSFLPITHLSRSTRRSRKGNGQVGHALGRRRLYPAHIQALCAFGVHTPLTPQPRVSSRSRGHIWRCNAKAALKTATIRVAKAINRPSIRKRDVRARARCRAAPRATAASPGRPLQILTPSQQQKSTHTPAAVETQVQCR